MLKGCLKIVFLSFIITLLLSVSYVGYNHSFNRSVVNTNSLHLDTAFKIKRENRTNIGSTNNIYDQNKSGQTCCTQPCTRIVFIKTHKTASSTVSSIFQRYGYSHNLLFALPKGNGHLFPDSERFPAKSVKPLSKGLTQYGRTYEILTNHVRYDRPGIARLIPNAKYITTLRDPVTQLESAFGYFEMATGMGLNNTKNPFQTFVENPQYYYQIKDYNMKKRSRNGQLYDLGFEPQFFKDSSAILNKVQTLDEEFDLVLLTEYLDESLILLKRLLCWSFADILYISKGIRSKTHRYHITSDLRQKIRQWNQGDVILYNHFNRTLWTKIKQYGSNFDRDLRYYKELKYKLLDRCIDKNSVDGQDVREDRFVLNYRKGGDFCRNLLRRPEEYTELLKSIMKLSG